MDFLRELDTLRRNGVTTSRPARWSRYGLYRATGL